MLEINDVSFTARLTRDPETRSTNAGKMVAKIDAAINRRGYNGGQDEACFIEVNAWEKLAEFAKNYLHKGSGIYVKGRLKQETWQDRETGANRSKIVVVAERLTFGESKAEAGGEYDGPSRRQQVNTAMGNGEGRAPVASATSEARIPDTDTETDQSLPF